MKVGYRGKRLFDVVISLLGLVILSPVFLLVSALIKIDSEGPIFFRQRRVGLNEEVFEIHKFRSMKVQKITDSGALLTVAGDLRITRVGRFIRKYKIDELPQLFDVLRGKMSLVGPRPEVPKYVAYYPEAIRRKIFQVRPGITDLASIHYKDEASLLNSSADPQQVYITDILPAKLRYSLAMLERPSLKTDVVVIINTLKAIIR